MNERRQNEKPGGRQLPHSFRFAAKSERAKSSSTRNKRHRKLEYHALPPYLNGGQAERAACDFLALAAVMLLIFVVACVAAIAGIAGGVADGGSFATAIARAKSRLRSWPELREEPPQPPPPKPHSPPPPPTSPPALPPHSPPPLPPPPRLPAPPIIPPPNPPGVAVLNGINARFAHAVPSNDLRVAGVLVHNIDEISNGDTPWKPCSLGGCAVKFSDRFPCSIIYPTNVHMYKAENGGFVIRPGAGANVLCSYSRDGLTMTGGKVCGVPNPTGCIPGCGWAPYEWCPEAVPWRCAWPPKKLDQMLEAHQQYNTKQHNEVVLQARAWTEQMPSTIEAVWFFEASGPGDEHDRQKLLKARVYVEGVHKRFLDAFGLSASEVPLLAFDPTRSRPFRIA